MNQCWNIVNWTPRNKLKWTVNQNSIIFIQENLFKNVVWKWRPFCRGLNVLKQRVFWFQWCSSHTAYLPSIDNRFKVDWLNLGRYGIKSKYMIYMYMQIYYICLCNYRFYFLVDVNPWIIRDERSCLSLPLIQWDLDSRVRSLKKSSSSPWRQLVTVRIYSW